MIPLSRGQSLGDVRNSIACKQITGSKDLMGSLANEDTQKGNSYVEKNSALLIIKEIHTNFTIRHDDGRTAYYSKGKDNQYCKYVDRGGFLYSSED